MGINPQVTFAEEEGNAAGARAACSGAALVVSDSLVDGVPDPPHLLLQA